MALEIPSISSTGKSKPVTVSEMVFGQNYNQGLVHQLVTTYLANGRAGTKAQKNRSRVRGGGRKPWRQKGTGQARSGTTRSPLWRSGGVTFAATRRPFDKKLNKKMYRVGMRSILSELLRQQRIFVSKEVTPDVPKTKELVKILKQGDALDSLIVTDKEDQNLSLASRNLINVAVCTTKNLNPVSLIKSQKVILTHEAVKDIEERLG